ncbi:MAG: Gfo/Idh/MocA family protein [Candidatus Hinthialibacter sp.]
MTKKLTRRQFNQAAAGTSFLLASAPAVNVLGANEKVNVGLIGCSGRGMGLIREFMKLDANFLAVCDVDHQRLEQGRDIAGVEESAAYKDYRNLLEHKGLDAVIIATPPHWHAIPFVDACKAGLDIYCEKALAVTIWEGQQMIKAARKYDRVVQCGTQSHSAVNFQEGVQLIHEGYIGKVQQVKTWSIRNNDPKGIGDAVVTDPPEHLDWDFWLGPLPKRPYFPQRCHGGFRWFWDTDGGWMTDWGVHQLDIVLWAIQQSDPLSITAEGGKFFFTDCSETPDTLETSFGFHDCLVQFSVRSGNAFNPAHEPEMPTWDGYGIEFYGSKGTLFLDRDRLIVWPEKEPFGQGTPAINKTVDHNEMNQRHITDFLTKLKTRERCVCDVEVCHKASNICHLGSIAYRTGERLLWNGVDEIITNHPKLNSWLRRPYRKPWKLEI